MENHSLDQFLNPKLLFGDEKYKAQVESLLFSQENQSIINKVIQIFEKNSLYFKFLESRNFDPTHINALICQTLIPKSKFQEFKSNMENKQQYQFQTTTQIIFGDQIRMVGIAKNLVNKFSNIQFQDTLVKNFAEMIKYQNINIEFDLQEANMFYEKQNQNDQIDFVRQYLFYNLRENENYAQQLYQRNNIEFNQSNDSNIQNVIIVMDELKKWNNYFLELIKFLSKQHSVKRGEIQIAQYYDVYDVNQFIPIQLMTDTFDKVIYFPKVEQLQQLTKKNIYEYSKIKEYFVPLNPLEVLIYITELFDWCEDIIVWDQRMTLYLQNLTASFSSSRELVKGQNNIPNIDINQILNQLIDDILLTQQQRNNTYVVEDINNLELVDSFEGVIYEVTLASIQFLILSKAKEHQFFGEIFIHPSITLSVPNTLIKQLLLDLVITKKQNFFYNTVFTDQTKQFFVQTNQMDKFYKMLVYLVLNQLEDSCYWGTISEDDCNEKQ